MKLQWYVLAILGCVALGICGVVLFYLTRNVYLPRNDTLHAISRFRSRFLRDNHPLKRFSLLDLPQAAHAAELLDPRANLPQTHRFVPAEIQALFRYSESCQKNELAKSTSTDLQKARQWHRFLCVQNRRLPKRFFEIPPYLHPSGRSFAALALTSGRPQFDEAWARTHRDYFHIRELPRGKRGALPPLQELVSGLGPNALSSLLREEELVQSENYLIFREASPSPLGQPTTFAVYDLETWKRFLASTPFSTSPLPSVQFCLYRTGNLCWHANEARWRRQTRVYTLLILASLAGSALVALVFLLQKRRARKVEEEVRLFHLQMLTHELRTPATVLALSLEGLRRDFDQLPQTSQRNMLRMCDELQRIERLVKESSRYLKVDGPRFQYVTLPSVNAYFGALVEKYGERIRWRPSPRDTSFSLAPYWLEICLHNLVDNALQHGAPPVEVFLEATHKALKLTVADAGTFTNNPGKDASRTQGGLGLGLDLVRRIVAAMKGRLSLQTAPTSFCILLRAPA